MPSTKWPVGIEPAFLLTLRVSLTAEVHCRPRLINNRVIFNGCRLHDKPARNTRFVLSDNCGLSLVYEQGTVKEAIEMTGEQRRAQVLGTRGDLVRPTIFDPSNTLLRKALCRRLALPI